MLPAVVELIQSCWHRDPSQRPTAEQVVQQLKALVGPEAGEEEAAAAGRAKAAALAAQQPPKPQPKARPPNPFSSRAGALFP